MRGRPDRRPAPTPESCWLERRAFLRALGFGAAGLAAGQVVPARRSNARRTGIPQRRPAAFRSAGIPITPEETALSYNNFYEFSTDKRRVRRLAAAMALSPWDVEIDGLVEHPGRYAVDELERLVAPEERIYRFRCVEAWSMVLPWTGIPLGRLLRRLGAQNGARYVRFVSRLDPESMPGVAADPNYPWPYFEALRLDEAMHDLTLLATGLYGKPLSPQNGGPIRLVVPWKYGFKSAKSLARIELTRERPPAFWHTVQPQEYSWLANVDPSRPHPRWSQASERRIDTGERIPTLPYNGYGPEVAHLYRG